MKADCIIGIDPGAAGGIAVYLPGRKVQAVKMPKNLRDLRDFFGHLVENYHPLAFLEKLSVRPDDVTAEGGQAKKMIANYEQLKAMLEAAELPYVMVHPMSWQSRLGIRVKGEEKPERKRRYKAIAGDMYPEVKITMWNADALLIMHFGRIAVEIDQRWLKANLPDAEQKKIF